MNCIDLISVTTGAAPNEKSDNGDQFGRCFGHLMAGNPAPTAGALELR